MKKKNISIVKILCVFVVCFIIGWCICHFSEKTSKSTPSTNPTETPTTNEPSTTNKPSQNEVVEDVSKYVVVSGTDKEYGFYYEVQLNDGSTIRYYESDGIYDIIEQTETSTTIETPDYYLVISENGSEVRLKEKDEIVLNDCAGINAD